MTGSFFEYALPLSATKGGPQKGDEKKKGNEPKEGEKKKKDDGKIRTQMVGETPDEDLGYDPKKIPTEDI